MLTTNMAQRTIDSLRRPCILRLITLVVSLLLAMSLGYATLVMALPKSGYEVAWFPNIRHSQVTFAAHLKAGNRWDFTPNIPGAEQVWGKPTEYQGPERRPS